MPVYQQRAACQMHVGARADVDVLERLGQVEQPADMHVESEAAQQAPEDRQVVDKTGHETL